MTSLDSPDGSKKEKNGEKTSKNSPHVVRPADAPHAAHVARRVAAVEFVAVVEVDGLFEVVPWSRETRKKEKKEREEE